MSLRDFEVNPVQFFIDNRIREGIQKQAASTAAP